MAVELWNRLLKEAARLLVEAIFYVCVALLPSTIVIIERLERPVRQDHEV